MSANGRENVDEAFRLSDKYQNVKRELHRHLIQVIEENNIPVEQWSRARLHEFVAQHIAQYVMNKRLPVNRRETARLADDAMDELAGYGPIQPLVDDDSIDDILVNGKSDIFIERSGRLERAAVRFMDDAHVMRIIQRILAPLGRRIDESTPMVDARLPDGSRVNAVIPPVALDGPSISIRKFRKTPLTAEELIETGSLSREVVEFLKQKVESRTSLLVMGGTGSGKTTLLNILSQYIPIGERIVTVEDAAELRLEHNHVVRLETRPPNLEGNGEIAARDLVRNALRMRPDRIILGEIRGEEVLDMLQAMNTGHEGSMATLHANNPRDAIRRLELLASFAGFTAGSKVLRQQIASALDLLVHVSRRSDGRRRLLSVMELVEQGDNLVLRELFRYEPETDSIRDTRSERQRVHIDGSEAA